MAHDTVNIPQVIPGLVTLTQAAAVHGVSVWAIRQRTKTGELHPVQVGRSLLYEVDELDRVFGRADGAA